MNVRSGIHAAAARSSARRTPSPRLSVAPITTAFVAIAVMVVLGVITADRMIAGAQRTEARLDAARTALIASTYMGGQIQSLHSLHAVFLDNSTPSPEQVEEVIEALGTTGMQFRRFWVVTPNGRVLADQRLGYAAASAAGGTVAPRLTRIDTATSPNLARLVIAASTTGRPHVWASRPVPAAGRGFVILDPVLVRGQVVGFVAASVPDAAMEVALRGTADPRRVRMIVRSGADTVAMLTGALQPSDSARRVFGVSGARLTEVAEVPLPEGVRSGTGPWSVTVVHQYDGITRLALWGVAAVFLVVLGLALWNERRQLRRLADRSNELEHLSSELLRANRTKSEFLANVSHELRTPLNAIVGFAELLREGVYGEMSHKQLGPLDRIEASASHLRHLVDQVLDLARMAAGRLEVHAEPVSLRAFILDVATEIESLINERKLVLSLAVPAMLPKVRTDPTHLRQILINLLSNAIKFTPSGSILIRGRLVLAAEAPAWQGSVAVSGGSALRAQAPDPERPWVALQVVDTGIGIDPRDQARIFEEFEQVNPGARGDSMHRGTGLGLPLSRRLAQLLGGEITVESELGRGSVFTVWLPVDSADLAAAASLGGRSTPLVVGVIQDGTTRRPEATHPGDAAEGDSERDPGRAPDAS